MKFAVIAAIIPSLPAGGNVVLTFADQPSSNNAPIAAADLLTQFPDFDAVTRITIWTSRAHWELRPGPEPLVRGNKWIDNPRY